MARDQCDAVAHQLASERHRLIRVAEIIADNQLDILAKDTAPSVEIRDRHLGAALIAVAGPGVVASDRAGQANPDLGL
jgi:hypothetical protein